MLNVEKNCVACSIHNSQKMVSGDIYHDGEGFDVSMLNIEKSNRAQRIQQCL